MKTVAVMTSVPQCLTRSWLHQSLMALFALLASTSALAQGPLPSVQITNLGTPVGGCTNSSTALTVFANGTSANSDNFTMAVNGVVQNTWTGENMSWAAPSSPPGGSYSYGANTLVGTFPANSTITVAITTYAGTNASSPFTTGQTPVYLSTISWNCTTGVQVGSIINQDLRVPVASAPANSLYALLFGSCGLLALGGLMLRRRDPRSAG